jgi:hypothetical protein
MLQSAVSFEDIEVVYMTVKSNTTNVEIYAQGFYADSYKNAVPGTFLSNTVTDCKNGTTEFYMLT